MGALRPLGGSAPASEVVDKVAELEKVSDKEREVTLASGAERFANQIQWARQYLVWEGLIDASKRGIWTLTPKGMATKLTQEQSQEVFLNQVRVQSLRRKEKTASASESKEAQQIEIENVEQSDDESELRTFLSVVRSLSPGGFERICMRVLREAGFERLQVTGKSNDGGVDGIGVLQVNDLVKFNVIFQCKKWVNPVPSKEIRDLPGAMSGRAEKAIFLTTSTFSPAAKAEALRAGTDPIELVDGEKLLELFKKYQIGLKPRVVYDIDQDFFDAFEKGAEERK